MIGLRYYLEGEKFASNGDLQSWLSILRSAEYLMLNSLVPANLELLPIIRTHIGRVERGLAREAKIQKEQEHLDETLEENSKKRLKLKGKAKNQRKSRRLAKQNTELSIQSSLQDLDINISKI